MRTTTRLRQLVTRPEIAFMMEAHDGLSARIVEEAGFEGIWASGLTLSASFGVRAQRIEPVGVVYLWPKR